MESHKSSILSRTGVDYNIQKSVIIDIDTLIMYALLLKSQQLDLFDLIDEYFSNSGRSAFGDDCSQKVNN